MDTTVEMLAAQHDELDGLLRGLTAAQWTRPTRCEGWTVRDVVLHLAQSDEMAIGSATGRFDEVLGELTAGLPPAADVDAAVAAMVDDDRDATPDEVYERWRVRAAEMRGALAALDPGERLTWVAGQLTARTLTTTRLAESWIHTGDVAAGLGVDLAPTARLEPIARLAWRTLPYAFMRGGRELRGPVAMELDGPAGEHWVFTPDEAAATTIRGTAAELCEVAARRVDPASSSLQGDGPDVAAVLDLIRTYA